MGILRTLGIRNMAIRATFGSIREQAIRATTFAGAALDPFLPTSYADLLSWQDTEDAMTTVDAVAQDPSTWTRSNLTIVSGVPDPFAGNAAHTLFETVTVGTHSTTVTWTGTRQNGDAEFDVYVLREGLLGRNVAIGITTAQCVVVSLDDGNVNFVGGIGTPFAMVRTTSAGGGWWRIRGLVTGGAALPAPLMWSTNSLTAVGTYAGSVTNGIRIYSAAGYFVQRMVSSLPVKAGTAAIASAQVTDANRPFLVDDTTLNKRVIGSFSPSNTKTLTDDPAIATALSGVDKAFTVTWLGRSAGSVAATWLALTGAPAVHSVLATTATSGFGMSRTDDAAATATAAFAVTDFTLDRNWHAFSVVFSGTSATLWIDGQQSSTVFALDVGTSAFTSAIATFLSNYWRERTIYSRALTATERANVELGMISRAGLPVPSLANPLNVPGVQGWWETSTGVVLSVATINPDLTAATGVDMSVAAGGGGYVLTEGVAANTQHYLSVIPTTNVVDGTLRFTADIKKEVGGTRDWVAFGGNFATGKIAYFDILNGVVGTVSNGTSSIVDLGGGWYRCTYEYIWAAGAPTPRIYSAEADNDATMNGSGVAEYVVTGVTVKQERMSAWVSGDLSRTGIRQATAASQPFYCSADYASAGAINGYPAIGENNNTATESGATIASFSGIFTGNDVPISMVGLFNKIGTPGSSISVFTFSTPGVHRTLRITSLGIAEAFSADDAATVVQSNFAALPDGVETISQVYNGTDEKFYRGGAQLGPTVPMALGVSTFGTSMAFTVRRITSRGFAFANRELTTAERTALEDGFNARAGIP